MGNNLDAVSDPYAGGVITNAIVAGCALVTIISVLIWVWISGRWRVRVETVEREENPPDKEEIEGKLINESFAERFTRKYSDISSYGFFWILIVSVFSTATIVNTVSISTPSDLFQLRIGESLFGKCSESLVNSGICAMTPNAVGRALIFTINAYAHAIYMKWTREFTGIYVVLTVFNWIFVVLYVIFGLYTALWVFFGLATAGFIARAGICITSSFDSLFFSGNVAKNPEGYELTRRKGGINGRYPEIYSRGYIMNVVNYSYGTWEFWLNTGEWVFGIFGYWTIFYIGTSGRILLTAGNEMIAYLCLDIVYLFLFNALKLWTWTNKSEFEVKTVGKNLQNRAPRLPSSFRKGSQRGFDNFNN